MNRIPVEATVLLVIAHPDDEIMFFAPTLSRLRRHLNDPADQIHVISVTPGEMSKDGIDRVVELEKSIRQVLGLRRCKALDYQDGLSESWLLSDLADNLRDYIAENGIEYVLTFDDRGVSGHPDHIRTYEAVREMKHSYLSNLRATGLVDCYALRSLPLYLKYMGWFGVLCALLFRSSETWGVVCVSYVTSLRGLLKAHRSQLRWYRLAFLVLSTYSLLNQYRSVPSTRELSPSSYFPSSQGARTIEV